MAEARAISRTGLTGFKSPAFPYPAFSRGKRIGFSFRPAFLLPNGLRAPGDLILLRADRIGPAAGNASTGHCSMTSRILADRFNCRHRRVARVPTARDRRERALLRGRVCS